MVPTADTSPIDACIQRWRLHLGDGATITEFKVMIRSLQAVNLMHAQMQAMRETLSG